MARIVLPTHPLAASAEPRYLDFGTTQDGGFAGAGPRIHRLGNRFALDVVMPTQWLEPHRRWGVGGRVFLSRLRQAVEFGAIYPWPQPGFKIGAPGAPQIAEEVEANLDVLVLSGFRPRYVIREGQFFNPVHGGLHYLHHSTAEVEVGADGTAEVPILPRLRTNLVAGDALRMDPVIEGRLSGDEHKWSLSPSTHVPISFSIEEYGVFTEDAEDPE